MAEQNIKLLQCVDLFSDLSDTQLSIIAQLAVRKKYQKNEVVLLENDVSNLAIFIIVEGEVEVFMTGVDGREIILSILGPGDFFGEMSLIDGEPRSASVRSLKDSELVMIRREDFMNALQKFPDITMSLLMEMSRRLRKADRQIGSLALLSVYGRVADTLLNLVQERGVRVQTEHGSVITVLRDRPTHQRLAEMSGTTRETVTRVLNSLQRKGWINISGRDLFVLEEEELRSHTER